MVKKVRVALHGFQRRGVQVDADATEGAVLGLNLYWPDGTLVTAADFQALASNAVASTGIDQNTLNYILSQLNNDAGGEITDYPLHKYTLTEPLTIEADFQYIIYREFDIQDSFTVAPGGELVILDSGLPAPTDPAFTYDGGGDLTRIDYDDGSFKEFTYNTGDLTRVDFTDSDGVVLRKDFIYSGSDLDYVDEYYV